MLVHYPFLANMTYCHYYDPSTTIIRHTNSQIAVKPFNNRLSAASICPEILQRALTKINRLENQLYTQLYLADSKRIYPMVIHIIHYNKTHVQTTTRSHNHALINCSNKTSRCGNEWHRTSTNESIYIYLYSQQLPHHQ